MSIRSLRWRLARWIAPAPIVADPFPGREAYVVHRSFGEQRIEAAFALDTLNIEVTHEPVNAFGLDPETAYFNNWRRRLVVTGTAES